MNKVAAILAVAILAYSIYYDLTVGTLSAGQAVTAESKIVSSGLESDQQVPYILKRTKSGDTVISIEENIHQGPLPVSIDQLIDDFKHLNNGIRPHEIQVNKEYKFPVYTPADD